jgi:hypothetical protein
MIIRLSFPLVGTVDDGVAPESIANVRFGVVSNW